MPTLTIRNIDEGLKSRLRIRAAQNGRSMEEEARQILRIAMALGESAHQNLAETIRKRFAPFGGVELPERDREVVRDPPKFE